VKEIVFAVPGDINTQSGGYGYDRRLMHELRLQGRSVRHLELGASYPYPSVAHAAQAARVLAEIASDCVVIIDGLALGAMDPAVITSLQAELVALIHHPLALEGDLPAGHRERLFNNERENLRHAKRVIVPSPHTAKLLVLEYGVPTEIITVARPGIDRIDKVAKEKDPPLILSVGIQVPRKGHDVLLRALWSMRELPWQPVIVGPALDLQYASSILHLSKELGLEARVTIAGQLSDEALSELYRSATVFALATRFEGYGMVFAEAMVHGLPIVSCNVGAVSETVPEQAGLLVQADEPEAFGLALAKLLESPGLRQKMASAALEAGAKLISWEESARLVGEMLDSLTAGNN
jgi:glycosyltransferase involved in cell wall biosynthesis